MRFNNLTQLGQILRQVFSFDKLSEALGRQLSLPLGE